MKIFAFLLFLFLLTACQTRDKETAEKMVSSLPQERDTTLQADVLYARHCAGCHGANMQGNSAASLLSSVKKYGSSRGLMIRNVSYGIPGTEMGAFNQVLSREQIAALVDHIRGAEDHPPLERAGIPAKIKTDKYTLEVLSIGMDEVENPWAIEFVDANRALISEKKGQLRWLVDDQLDPNPIKGTPVPFTAASTAGYMDIALDPAYGSNGWVYLAYSYSKADPTDKDAPALTRIVRGKIKGRDWTAQQTLFEAPDSLWPVKGNRWGCRFLFDDEGRLLFTIGDMAQDMDSQDLSKPTGKVFRINPDGSIPKDNPFVGRPGALEAIFTIGNRNVQGLDMHPETRQIWASEHGPMGGDEINILTKGANYGWPVITYGLDYDGATVSSQTHREGMEQPVLQWTPSIAVCPIAFVKSPLFPEWENNLMVGALAFEDLRRYEVQGDQLIEKEMILKDAGRVRDIKIAPDGSVYVLLNQPDVVLKMTVSDDML